MRHRIAPLRLLPLAALATGCASITTGHNQSLGVETRLDGQPDASTPHIAPQPVGNDT